MKKLHLFLLLLALSTFPFAPLDAQPNKRALRGVWIATVANIDWPAKPGLPVAQQQAEMVALLDKVKACHMNTVVLQIRPTADAFYISALEPSSYWLTGEQGAETGYDPLQFAIDECHKRGLYIHVWLNPYRITNDTVVHNKYAPAHVIRQHPEWMVTYGSGQYFNPGLDEVRAFTCRVVEDIVRRYDIDAVHMDDYFYPYKIKGKEFPDSLTFAEHPRGFTSREDWRRDNVNRIIREINETIKSVKPWVEFGVSPFAIWRNQAEDPRGSATKGGTTNYDGLYADILLWQAQGWIDYVLPQLYFHIGFPVADYAVLADWWSQYSYGTTVYAGLAPYRISKKSPQKEWRSKKEILRQIRRNSEDPNLKGEIYFSAKSLFRNPDVGLEKRLPKKEYRTWSIAPENNRIARIAPESPSGVVLQAVNGQEVRLQWERGENAKRFVVYKFKRNQPVNLDNPAAIVAVTGLTEVTLPCKSRCLKKYRFGVTALSPSHTESAVVFFD
ncbi:MAG: family 10 glycosylhydrolase [Prevotellaceae bacterium]|jgi:uncharacterized lipoprotein YddW (UPF0748 family)|nr:family 10 glycosylhydrolase [Prevotellaceae bacterium]